ncbi:MAG: stage II sporulation protein M [Candidatus Micrarchaeia archaeon]|jgi:uncharacterized membrane protein SpoIIM required for sporulation
MVLEVLLDPESAVKTPLKITVVAFFFVTVGVWTAQFFDSATAGLMAVVAVTIPSVPMISSLFAYEESETEEEARITHSRTLSRHVSVLIVLVAYFVGLVMGFTAWYLLLPDQAGHEIFSTQISQLEQIRGNFYYGFAVKYGMEYAFETIFLRNLQVLMLILATSVIYGAGSIFILAWNASIIGVFLGEIAKTYVFHAAPGFSLAAGIGKGVLGLVPHGSFELLAYLVAALAGGILSSSIVRKIYTRPEFAVILYDVAKLVSWSVFLLAIGAAIEGNAIANP